MRDNYRVVSGIVFGVVAILQAIRRYNQWPVQIGPVAVPAWFSGLAVIGAGALCIWALASRRQQRLFRRI
jgi:hypothetical protein